MAAIFNSVVGFLTMLATARLELVIPTECDRSSAERLTQALLAWAAVVSALITLVMLVGGVFFCNQMHTPALSHYLWLLPLAVFGAAAFQLGTYRMIREQNYTILAHTRLHQAIYGVSTSTSLGWFHIGPIGLLLGTAMNQSVGALTLLRDLLSPAFYRFQNHSHSAAILWSKREYAVKTLCAGILGASGALLVPLIFSAFYGVEATGALSVALRLMLLPMTIVGAAISQAFVGEAANVLRTEPSSFRNLVRRFVRRLLPFALITTVAGVAMPWVIPFCLGPSWKQAGILSAIIAPMCGMQLLVSPIGMIPIVLKRPGIQLLLDFVRAFTVVGALVIAYAARFTILEATIMYAAASMITFLIMFYVFRKLIQQIR